jgi:hypothetical protein
MKPALLFTDPQGLAEDPFEIPCPPRRVLRSAPFGRTRERSAFSLGVTPLPLPSLSAEISPLLRPPWCLPSERPLQPFLGLAEGLHRLYVSEQFALSPSLLQRLAELLTLKPGWDGERAIPPKPEVLAHIVGLLTLMKAAVPAFQEPFLAPTIDGFAQLEWTDGRRLLEFEATATGWSILGSETTVRGEQAYHEADTARFEVESLLTAYRWFQGTELLWPIL